MSETLQQQTKLYIKSIKKKLSCKYGMKKAFISEFKSQIDDYLEANPNASISDIENNFGNAESIAKNFDSLITDDLRRKAKIATIFFNISIIQAILLVISTTVLIILLMDYSSAIIIKDPHK